MKTSLTFLRLALVILAGVALSSLALPAAEEEDARAAIIKIEEEMAAALASNDLGAMKKYAADDWRTVNNNGRVHTLGQVDEFIRSGTLKFTSFKISDMEVRIHGDTAIVIGKGTATGALGAESFRSTDRFTDVFVKKDGAWKIVSSHVSTLEE